MNQSEIDYSDRRNEEIRAQTEVAASEAQKELVRAFVAQTAAWDQGTVEANITPLLVDALLKIENGTHIGYVYRLALTGEAFEEFRSTKASRPGRLHVYGRTPSGEIQYAGSMDRKSQLYYAIKRQEKADQQSLRHRTAPSWDRRRK